MTFMPLILYFTSSPTSSNAAILAAVVIQVFMCHSNSGEMDFQVFVPLVSLHHVCCSSCGASARLAPPTTALQKPAVSHVLGWAAPRPPSSAIRSLQSFHFIISSKKREIRLTRERLRHCPEIFCDWTSTANYSRLPVAAHICEHSSRNTLSSNWFLNA